MALNISENKEKSDSANSVGLSRAEILQTFYDKNEYFPHQKGWRTKFIPEHYHGSRLIYDLVDVRDEKVLVKAKEKLTLRNAKKLADSGLSEILVKEEDILLHYLAEDLVDSSTGEVIALSGSEITLEILNNLKDLKKSFSLLFIDNIKIGPYLRDTLVMDKHISREEALVDIYNVMRPGEPPTVESAEALFQSLFFDEGRYDLSDVGRVKMNQRLNNEDNTLRVLTNNDIIGIVKILLKLKVGQEQIDDIDNLGNRRVRSVGELLENHYRSGMMRMERTIKERIGAVEIDSVMPHDLINSKPISAVIKEFFASSQLSQFMDQINPLSEITHKRRLSALGPGGLTRDRASFEVRDVHPTHYGRICPIETPEGPNIGLINSLASYARINKFGFIESPYRRVEKGSVVEEVVYMSAIEESRYAIAQSDATIDEKGKLCDDFVSCRKGGEFTIAPASEIDFIDVSPKQLVSIATSLIPFLENDDANRALMGSNMQRQAVPLMQTEAPVVGTGMEEVVAKDSGVTVIAKRGGIIDQVDADRIVIKITDIDSDDLSVVDIYKLQKYQRSNQDTCITQKPLVRPGDNVKSGEVIADGQSTDGGELALGKNVLVGFLSWKGYNFEDSIIVSERVVNEDVFTSIQIEEFEAVTRDTKLGQEEITRDIPNTGDDVLRYLDEAGIISIGADVKAGDILVGKITPKGDSSGTPEEKLLRAIFGEKAVDVRDSSLRVPPGVQGTVVEVRIFNRRGVEKDERALAIEQVDVNKLAQDKDTEVNILERGLVGRLSDLISGKQASSIPGSTRKNLLLDKNVVVGLSNMQVMGCKIRRC